ncbi:MAG: YtxH domain-containing protein [Peptoanaerobacter stomatis]|uniref:YtxH domain-containing protein n=1 Tax=Peptoanaerobacter stomatis TaxID=796937 RepID=UPI003FA0ABFE
MRRTNCETNLFAIVGATAIGAIIGVAFGLMFAPKSGNELREQLVTSGKDLVNKNKYKKDSFFDEDDEDIDEIGDFSDSI